MTDKKDQTSPPSLFPPPCWSSAHGHPSPGPNPDGFWLSSGDPGSVQGTNQALEWETLSQGILPAQLSPHLMSPNHSGIEQLTPSS